MRRLVPLLLLAPLAVTGCGTEQPAEAPSAAADAPSSATPTQTPTPTPTPTPGALSTDFPLALGYDEENGDDHSPVVVTGRPATQAFEECHRQVWDPAAGSDVIGVEFRGEAEWSRGRTLVLYPSTDAAIAAVDKVADTITNCPRDNGDEYGWTEHSGINYYVGDQSFGWIDRYWTAEVGGFDTGLTIYHVVRVGRSVLLTYEYGEGNGSEQILLSAFARAEKADRPVVDAMSTLPT